MNELVKVKGSDVFTDTLIIAEGIQRKHDSVTKLIKRYKNDFEELGKVGLTVRASGSGQKQNVYELNETQAVFILTLMDNSLMVRKFKKELSRQFVTLRHLLLERQSSEWLQTRKHGKLVRRQETDVIAELIVYAKKQGSKNADMLYMNYSKLVNSLVDIKAGQRELATEKVLSVIALIEDLILNTVQEEMSAGVYYKEIYQHCKAKATSMMQYVYLPAERILIA
ncbi:MULTISPECIES: Rha family transcriptional regulator [Paenibacillus]|uniref:Rha family transcriptional regulator n=1 Tax=Paenibacillus TaxID=44249 RepID=UPI00096C7307|nr:Rha family transcriptional regulator [Paenibacillus odorifer]OMD06452.1 hypothetical protein BJP50_11080 [Paenibacillus odorifer]